MKLKIKIEGKRQSITSTRDLFMNEDGAIDLASIMVGIIVIGLIGGVIASTIFVVIPWTQDNAAKQQLDSVVSAESAYFGLSASNPPALPAGSKVNSFGKSTELAAANLLQSGNTYCVTTPADSKSYDAYSQSASGVIFNVTDKNSKPVIFTGTLPTDCQFIAAGTATATPSASPSPVPYVDPTPTLTIMTYKCDTNLTYGAMPLAGSVSGTETWSDGLTKTVTGSSSPARSFTAGVTYQVTFQGTYTAITRNQTSFSLDLNKCLRSVDHLGSNSGVTNMNQAFAQATNLTSVPAHVPTTITNMQYMFWGDTQLNDPDISTWDVSNVTVMSDMFESATSFNQSLNDWNISKVEYMDYMFSGAKNFNQPLDKWVPTGLRFTRNMFQNATTFNQPLNTWNTSQLYNASYMFSGATAFNQPLDKWNVAKVSDVSYMFQNDAGFNQDLSKWNTASVTSGSNFAPNTFNSAYLPPKTTKSP